MKYAIFNPITGTHSYVEGKEETTQQRNLLIRQSAVDYVENMKNIGNDKSYIAEEKRIAREFIKRQHGSDYDSEPLYMYSGYKLDTQSKLFSFYICLNANNGISWEVKITDGVVTEQYQSGPWSSTTEYTMTSNDLQTNEPIEYYRTLDKDMNIVPYDSPNFYAWAKYDMQGNMSPDLSIEGGISFSDLPEDKKLLLENFEYKDRIYGYKLHSIHGFLVYYTEDTKEPATQEQIDKAVEEYVTEWSDKYTVCEVVEHETGDATWVPVDFGKF